LNRSGNKSVHVFDWGLIDYEQAWERQENLFSRTVQLKIDNRKNGGNQPTPNYLIVCEHPHVYTLGKSGKESHLLLTPDQLNDINATFHRINRGGDITYHGPGQLVVYPIIDLDNFFTDIHKYLRTLEEAVIRTLLHFGIRSGRYEGLTGVWINENDPDKTAKICAMGVKCSRWVTMHGLALNVNTSLDYFNHIVPCGIDDKAVTSMEKELGYRLDFEEVKDKLLDELKFQFEMKELQL
jgi:lipoyl(octanoyl) transferase